MDLITTDNLSYRHPGGQAGIEGLNLRVPEASLFGFLGPNGAGKSTTLRLLLGLLRPRHGCVHLWGRTPSPAVLAQVGSCIEQPSLYAHLSALDNLAMGCALHGVAAGRAGEALQRVGLADAAHQRVAGFSLGMKQRLGLALALLHRPSLLVLDEPGNGLDPHGMVDLRALLTKLVREDGVTVLVSSHQLSEVERMATHVALLSAGRQVFQGPLHALRTLVPQAKDFEDVYLHLARPA